MKSVAPGIAPRIVAHFLSLSILVAGVGWIAQAAAAPPSGLVAAYGFDEGSGAIVADASGNGNGGTIDGATWTVGRFGAALDFNGTNARVTVNDASSLHLTTAMTLEAWVKPSTVDNVWQDVIYKGNDNYYLEATSTHSGNSIGGGQFGAGESYGEAIGTGALAASTWSHLAVTYDAVTRTLLLYVNGVQVSSKTTNGGGILTSANPLQIGGDSIYGQYFRGTIDEVRVYNVALTPAQIQADMSTAVGSAIPNTPSPVVSTTVYPLKKSTNGRYLVDQNNVPYLIVGDSPQALIVNLTEADTEMFFADRAAHGFNSVWINLLCNDYTGGPADGSTLDGTLPFTTPNDLSTPNEQYFAHVDRVIRLAAKYGLQVILDPAETGGWLSVLLDNGRTKARNYGRYLGNRYQSFDNIIWMSGNDFQDWSNSQNDAVVTAVALGIGDIDTRHIHTVELNYLVSSSLDDASWKPIISLNATYTSYPTYAQLLKDYNRANFLPNLMVEANYEFEHDYTGSATLRRQEYWSMLSGATGQLYGNGYTWPFIGGWQDHLDTPGAIQMQYVKALFEPRAWYNLVPDQDHSVVTAGYGTFTDTGSVDDSDYATAARTPDGRLVMAYMPTMRALTVDMSKLSAATTARWYDPSNGTYALIGDSLPNMGTQQFTPPGNNSDGDGDWVLVLEMTP